MQTKMKINHPQLMRPNEESYCSGCKDKHCSISSRSKSCTKLLAINKECIERIVGLIHSQSTRRAPAVNSLPITGNQQILSHYVHQVESLSAMPMVRNAERGKRQASNQRPASKQLSSLMFAYLPLVALIIMASFPDAEAVDCFKCSSRNGSNPACEDPFHNLNSTKVITPILPDVTQKVIYHAPCYAGKKGRDGLFPASACIKLVGTFERANGPTNSFSQLALTLLRSPLLLTCRNNNMIPKDTTGETLVVRHCALDSGTLTQDTELARMSHCGRFQFEGDLLQGCVLACPEDACNSAPKSARPTLKLFIVPSALVVLSIILSLSQPGRVTRN